MPEFTDLDCVQKKLMLHQFYLDHLILACVFPTKGKPKIPSKNHCKLFSVLENCCLIFQPCRFFKSSFLAFTFFCVADKLRGKPNIFTFQTLGVKLWNQKETKEFLFWWLRFTGSFYQLPLSWTAKSYLFLNKIRDILFLATNRTRWWIYK